MDQTNPADDRLEVKPVSGIPGLDPAGVRHHSGPGKPAGPERRSPDIPVRDRLLLAAAELFVRKGYAATSVHEIVEAAGVTKPVLYYYFQNKEGIFREILNRSNIELANILQTTRTIPGNALERLYSVLVRLYELAEDNLQIVRFMYALHFGPVQGVPEHDAESFHRQLETEILHLVEIAIQEGDVTPADPQDILLTMMGVLDTCLETKLCDPGKEMNAGRMVRLLQLLHRGMHA